VSSDKNTELAEHIYTAPSCTVVHATVTLMSSILSVGDIEWRPSRHGIWTAINTPQHVLLRTAIGINWCWCPWWTLDELGLSWLSRRHHDCRWRIARSSKHAVSWNDIKNQSRIKYGQQMIY